MHHTPPPIAPAARLVDISKRYMLDKTPVPAICSVSLTITRGAFLVITGPSGSGKSTLLNTLGCIDRPDQGSVEIAGRDIIAMSDRALTAFRASEIGFIFQSFNLLPVLTALENVEYPLQLTIPDPARRRERAAAALCKVGLGELLDRRPSELSGGQRQRVAIARALVRRPTLVIADEPTANLDQVTGAGIIALMREMQEESHTTFVFSSHDPQLIHAADHRVTLVDGVLRESAQPEESRPAQGKTHERS